MPYVIGTRKKKASTSDAEQEGKAKNLPSTTSSILVTYSRKT